jgi:flagellar M-ring protein FliF
VVKPLTAAEVAQINELVKQAMGYNQDRGDTLNVANAPFDGVDKPTPRKPWTGGRIRPTCRWRRSGKFLFIALVLLFLCYRILRPVLKPVMKKFDEAVEMPPEPEPEEPEAEPGPDATKKIAQHRWRERKNRSRSSSTRATWRWPRPWPERPAHRGKRHQGMAGC